MYQRSYSYHIINGNRSSNQISQLSYAANSSSLTPLSFTYTYDDRGNILTVNQGTSSSASYRYNSQNQLIEETVRSLTTRYTYDTAGNILSIADTLGLYPEKSFTYGNANWRDLLTSVSIGTNTINPITKKIYYQGQTYNAANDTVSGAPISGNPLNWYNGTEYTDLAWGKDRQLTSITTGGMTADYAYDMNGIRRSKTVTKASGTEQHSYLTQNGQVVRETIGTGTTAKVLDFVYDNNGQPFALCYSADGGAHFYDYFYITNMQGDVVRLVNSLGTTVANYSYDAWGNLLSSSGTLASINPLRYRSYYYDTETGFYYVSSRYYDPEIGRWINADNVIAGVGGDLKGYNLFAYCFNNPVNMDDQAGNWPKWIKNTVKWVAKNIVKPVVKTVQKTLSKVDLTYSTGVNVSGTPSAWIFNGQIGVSMDTKGNVAIQASGGGGITGGDPGISITRYQSVTNAPNIDKLNDAYYQVGGSIAVPIEGVPVAAGGDVMFMPDPALNTGYFGLTGNVGFGTPGKEFHVEWGTTVTLPYTQFNVYEVARSVYITIMEW